MTDFSICGATVVGYGNTGKQYVKALRALGVQHIRGKSVMDCLVMDCLWKGV